jgi:hypothetical protein
VKFIIISLVVSSSYVKATECININDSLDREYCFKKKVRVLKQNQSKELAQYKNGITQNNKSSLLKKTDQEIKNKIDLYNTLKEEIEITKEHKKKIAKLPIKKKDKKKKKNDFFKKLKKIKLKL